mmetsp:Transcript_66540/g.158772  ORF Transcript_66540/g.158772 Transcript_66540/m.158772 type:complete len:206 (-) Transcript_66540:945-1562(-)
MAHFLTCCSSQHLQAKADHPIARTQAGWRTELRRQARLGRLRLHAKNVEHDVTHYGLWHRHLEALHELQVHLELLHIALQQQELHRGGERRLTEALQLLALLLQQRCRHCVSFAPVLEHPPQPLHGQLRHRRLQEGAHHAVVGDGARDEAFGDQYREPQLGRVGVAAHCAGLQQAIIAHQVRRKAMVCHLLNPVGGLLNRSCFGT